MKSLLCLGAMALLMGQICAPGNQPPQNTAPTANAGTDQTVGFGTAVTLNGSASSDPDQGDTLSFAWTQTAGTAVTLAGANTATPSFVAPNTAGALSFQLTVTDGSGATDTDTVNVLVTEDAPPPVTPTLFIANSNTDSVTSYANPGTVNGNIAPDTNLAGAQTGLDFPLSLATDNNDALLVASLFTQAITAYDDAPNTNGNLTPDRNVQGIATLIIQPRGMVHSPGNDLVFLADNASNSINVFANASTNAFNGNVAPVRTINTLVTGDINQPQGIDRDSNDNLYVANRGGNEVLVFANASTLNGTVTPTRQFTSGFFNDIRDVHLLSNDTLLVLDTGTNSIYTYNNASTINGTVDPDFILVVSGATQIQAVVADSAGRGYISDTVNNAVFSYDNIATRNGTLVPERTIQGAQTQINNPQALYLLE